MTPDDRAVAPVAPACPRPCRWHACTAQRTGSLWCDQHAYAHRRAVISGSMPATAELAEMRPSEIAALIVVLPPRAATPPRACLWPDCGRPAPLRRLCPRCQARNRRLVRQGALPDMPREQSDAATLPALWAQYCYDLRVRRTRARRTRARRPGAGLPELALDVQTLVTR